jgi:hypothetical protein
MRFSHQDFVHTIVLHMINNQESSIRIKLKHLLSENISSSHRVSSKAWGFLVIS